MGKMKTHKGSKKRFKKTGKGKFKHKKPNRNHLLAKKESTRKHRLRKGKKVSDADKKRVEESLPYE